MFPPKLFTFHLEVQTTGGNVVHVSVGNMCKRKKEKEPQVCLSAPPPSIISQLCHADSRGREIRNSTGARGVVAGRPKRYHPTGASGETHPWLERRWLYWSALDTITTHQVVGTSFLRLTRLALTRAQGYKKHVQVAWEPEEPGWTMLCLDLPALVEAQSGMVYGSLKSLQLCSYMLLRGCYTSDLKFTPATLPRDMALPRGTEDNPLFKAKWVRFPTWGLWSSFREAATAKPVL